MSSNSAIFQNQIGYVLVIESILFHAVLGVLPGNITSRNPQLLDSFKRFRVTERSFRLKRDYPSHALLPKQTTGGSLTAVERVSS